MRLSLPVPPAVLVAVLLIPSFALAQPEEDEIISEDDVVLEDGDAVQEDDDEVIVDEGEDVATTARPEEAPSKEDRPTSPPQANATGGPVGTFEPGAEPFRAAPVGQGVVWGRVTDSKSGEPALEAQVRVLGTTVETFTDYDGYFRLELPPGSYKLEVFYELYDTQTLDGVVASAGEVQRTDVQIVAQAGAVEEVLIEDEAETQTIEGLALARQKAVAAGDAIGREEISKGTDSNAAEAAQRVVGANIVEGRFVYVRGLGGRYSNSLLSGYPLPSPEPDKAAVPLDVFPSSVLDSLTIVKSFTPDMPGDFAGGSVQIETRSAPAKPMLTISLTGALNTQSTFNDRMDYAGGGLDWFGFDDGTRALHASVPRNYELSVGTERPDGSLVTRSDLVPYGRALNTNMSSYLTQTPLNYGVSVAGGNTWDVGQGQKLGIIASFNYSRKFEKMYDQVVRQFIGDAQSERGYVALTDFKLNEDVDKVRWGTFGKVSYLPTKDHKISLTGLHSQLSDDAVRLYDGFNEGTRQRYTISQLDWVQRGVTFGVLSGRHTLAELAKAEFSWDASIAAASRSQPDRRDVVYAFRRARGGFEDSWAYTDGPESGRHFFAGQSETSIGGKADWKQPILEGSTSFHVKAGGLVNAKVRAFSARRFAFRSSQNPDIGTYLCGGSGYRLSCPDSLFIDDNIDSYVRLDEGSQPGDTYDAHLNVYAGYALADLNVADELRIVAGPRIEVTDQGLQALSVSGEQIRNRNAQLDSTDVLPAISVVLSGSKSTKTRASYARTLARPQLRELAPFAFSDYFGGYPITGNPNLLLTRIDNVDVRFEYWPSLREVMAISFFYKHFTDPIEEILVPSGTNNVITYRNAPNANLVGAEIEVRKDLSFISPVLNGFSVNTNLTLAWSRVDLTEQSTFVTTPYRPLMNQAPWVYNLALDYETQSGFRARAAYNVAGETLVLVGTVGVPDGYLQPAHVVDLSFGQRFLKSWEARLQIENIINDDITVTAGRDYVEENIVQRHTRGAVVSLSLGYEL